MREQTVPQTDARKERAVYSVPISRICSTISI